jgi:hypothetical protein
MQIWRSNPHGTKNLISITSTIYKRRSGVRPVSLIGYLICSIDAMFILENIRHFDP